MARRRGATSREEAEIEREASCQCGDISHHGSLRCSEKPHRRLFIRRWRLSHPSPSIVSEHRSLCLGTINSCSIRRPPCFGVQDQELYSVKSGDYDTVRLAVWISSQVYYATYFQVVFGWTTCKAFAYLKVKAGMWFTLRRLSFHKGSSRC
jgi:hypothetical protein